MVYFKVIIVFLGVILLSCKKDRVCECTVTDSGTSTTTSSLTFSISTFPIPPITFDTTSSNSYNTTDKRNLTLMDVTKKQAKGKCISYSEPYTETQNNSVPNFSLVTVRTGTRTYQCELK